MAGALLYSGKAQDFRALGADGQPVYRAAVPLRETIRLKLGADAANCLAVVQPSESGESFDWYAPVEGDVVPWSSATDEERASAYAQLEEVHARMLSTAETMEGDAGNREKQVFARLLRRALYFPGSEHVYLVNGRPVITFWGFAHPGGESLNPLLSLRPTPTVAAMAAAPVAAAVVAKSSPWRWLRWLLLLLLLLLLLWWLLHVCTQQVEPPRGAGNVPGVSAVDPRAEDLAELTPEELAALSPQERERRVRERERERERAERRARRKGSSWLQRLRDRLGVGDGVAGENGVDGLDADRLTEGLGEGEGLPGEGEGLPGEELLDGDALGDNPLGEDALGEDVLGENPLGEEGLGDEGLGENPLDEEPLGEDALGEDTLGQDPVDPVDPVDPFAQTDDDATPPPDLSGQDPDAQNPDAQNPDAQDPDAADSDQQPLPGMEPPDLDALDPQSNPQTDPPPNQAAPRKPSGPPLDIPQDAPKDGAAKFLNGRQLQATGLQDGKTGKPLGLDFDFDEKDGGEMRIQRGDGVECRGAVTRNMQGGRLGINAKGPAKCSDGSSYSVPPIECQPGSRRTNCVSVSKNQRIPMSMSEK